MTVRRVTCETCGQPGTRWVLDGAEHHLCYRHYHMTINGGAELSPVVDGVGIIEWTEAERRHLLFMGYLLRTGRIEGHPACLAVAASG